MLQQFAVEHEAMYIPSLASSGGRVGQQENFLACSFEWLSLLCCSLKTSGGIFGGTYLPAARSDCVLPVCRWTLLPCPTMFQERRRLEAFRPEVDAADFGFCVVWSVRHLSAPSLCSFLRTNRPSIPRPLSCLSVPWLGLSRPSGLPQHPPPFCVARAGHWNTCAACPGAAPLHSRVSSG